MKHTAIVFSLLILGSMVGGVTVLTQDAEAQSGPIEISDWNDLDDVRNNLGGDYVLVNDLDENTAGYGSVASASANGGNGWDKIGDSNAFTGTFDGQGYEIRDLVIDRSGTNEVGLFGVNEGTIKNLGVVDVDIVGYYAVGAVVGLNKGTIVNSYSSGYLETSSGSSGGTSGGLAGVSIGSVNAELPASIEESYSIVTVNGSNDIHGGLVGYNGGTITSSYANGDVSGNDEVGGLVGVNSYTVESSYATGNVDSGGPERRATRRASGSYATGNVDSGNAAGGLIGYNGGAVTDSYYDTSPNNGEGTQLSTSQMQGSSAPSNMAGFDFTNTWETAEASDGDATADGYPILQNISRSVQLGSQDILPASFDVTSSSFDDPVTVDTSGTVTTTVENTGQEATQTVELLVDGTVEDSQTVTLGTGQETTVALSWTPTSTGDYSVEFSTQDDSVTQTVTAEDPAIFNVTDLSFEQPVIDQEQNVTVTVQNDGGRAATHSIVLDVSGTTNSGQELQLDPGESGTVDLFWEPPGTGDYQVTGKSQDNSVIEDYSKSETVTVLEPANLDVDPISLPDIDAGSSYTVETTVTNNGGVSTTDVIELIVNGTVRDSTTITLSESTQVSLSWVPTSGDKNVTVSSPDDQESDTTTARTPPDPRVTEITADPVVEGDALNATVTIENAGEQSIEDNFVVTVGGSTLLNTTVDLSGGQTQTETVSYTTQTGDAPNVTASASFADASGQTALPVLSEPEFVVELVDPIEDHVGETDLSVEVTNVGNPQELTQTVTLGLSNETRQQNVTLGTDESTVVNWTITDLDPGTYDYEVLTEDRSVTDQFDVLTPGRINVTVSAPERVAQNTTQTINVLVENTGDTEITEFVSIGDVTQTVTLAGGEATTLEAEFTITEDRTITVEAGNESVSRSIETFNNGIIPGPGENEFPLVVLGGLAGLLIGVVALLVARR